MFLCIDNRTNEIIVSLNVEDCYKDTYNKSLRFTCIDCNDNKCSFVNSRKKLKHFRHSYVSNCNTSHKYIEFNNKYYYDWFSLFRNEYRKPYWFNYKLEQISNENTIIMIRYCHQTEEIIKNVEKYSTSNSKVIWILSLENRKFNRIIHHTNKYYISFNGSKNDIPIYDCKKSMVYLDTGHNVIIQVNLDNFKKIGQEVELIPIKVFCEKYSKLFIKCPERTEWDMLEILEHQKYKIILDYYDTELKYLLEYESICYLYHIKIENIKYLYHRYSIDFISKFIHISNEYIKFKKNKNIANIIISDIKTKISIIDTVYKQYIKKLEVEKHNDIENDLYFRMSKINQEIYILNQYDVYITEYYSSLYCCILNKKYYCSYCRKYCCRKCYLKKMKYILCCHICDKKYSDNIIIE